MKKGRLNVTRKWAKMRWIEDKFNEIEVKGSNRNSKNIESN